MYYFKGEPEMFFGGGAWRHAPPPKTLSGSPLMSLVFLVVTNVFNRFLNQSNQ